MSLRAVAYAYHKRTVVDRAGGSISTATYADGQPATHVRIVRTGGDEYFAVAWQIGLEHMASLRGTTASSVQPMDDSAAVATPPAEPATSSNAAPSRSELNNLLEALK